MDVLPDGIPICGVAGDQQAALFGQACFNPGDGKCTYGTGSFTLINTGATPILSKNGLLTTCAWQLGNKITYALEGSTFIAGAAVQWLRDNINLIEKSSDIETLAAEVDSADGVTFVPAFTGLGAPYWNAEARGAIFGLTRGTTKAHLARATLEGIAFQNAALYDAMKSDLASTLSVKPQTLKVDGGASLNNLLMQLQADILDIQIVRPKFVETTSLGAAFLAGLAVSLWASPKEIQDHWKMDRCFKPEMTAEERARRLAGWKKAVEKLLD